MSEVSETASVVAALDQMIRRLDDLDSSISRIRAETVSKEDLSGILKAGKELIMYLIEQQSSKVIEDLSVVLNKGIGIVFGDLDAQVKLEIKDYRGAPYIDLKVVSDGVEASPKDAFGGGLLSVISVLINVLVIVRMNRPRLLILDETFAHVSDEYLPQCGELLKFLVDKLHFKILMVTHQELFSNYADRMYQTVRKEDGVYVEEVREWKTV